MQEQAREQVEEAEMKLLGAEVEEEGCMELPIYLKSISVLAGAEVEEYIPTMIQPTDLRNQECLVEEL
jgi:hypothetical protein